MSNSGFHSGYCFGFNLIALAHSRIFILMDILDHIHTQMVHYFLTHWGSYKSKQWLRWVGFLSWKPNH
jgi:hypothetical protein